MMCDRFLETNGANPILPPGIYIPDGEPKVFGDRLYLYGSHDIFGEAYCCGDYHVFSAPVDDLTRWTDHGVSFRSRNESGGVADVPWSTALLYAPDAVKRGDTYYLYFCLSDGSEGVAQSFSPAGPFVNARRITLDGKPIEGIDPSVLCDGGKYYYTWGQFHLKIAELDDDMCTLIPGTLHDNVITNDDGAQGFHEGSSLRKIGDKFCLIYASEWQENYPNRSAPPTKLDYAVSDCVYGPYERKGTVIDNYGIDPKSWNNHGSVIKAGGKWYVFYHGSSNCTEFSRRARADRLDVDEENCIIRKAEMTANGFLDALPPSYIGSPAGASRFFGGAYVTQRANNLFPLVNITSGSGMEYRYVRFAAKQYRLTVRYTAFEDCVMAVSIDGSETACVNLLKGESEAQVCFEASEGDSVLTFAFAGSGEQLCEINNIQIV